MFQEPRTYGFPIPAPCSYKVPSVAILEHVISEWAHVPILKVPVLSSSLQR